ncbi:MAG: hypothetical protein ACYS0G_01660 [Planctomycetota bacterium]|jgi:hypothetical protein
MTIKNRTCNALCTTAAIALAAPVATADRLDITITGTVQSTELTRGPFADAQVGDAVTIAFEIDTDFDMGGGDLHLYETTGYTITIDDVSMTASAVPVFTFSTFEFFHGFEHTSTGLLLPGGGTEHNYRVPVFGASGPPDIWPPQGSAPEDHLGTFPADLFDTFNENTLTDQGAGGPGMDQDLVIDFDGSITIQSVCPWDLDTSGTVGIGDLLILLANWGTPGPGDFDFSGNVGIGDLLTLLANWGSCP